MKLGKDDYIITAYPELAAGPGWANSPVWVIVKNRMTAIIREECIQPDEFSRDMYVLFKPAVAAHETFLSVVKDLLTSKRRRVKK